MGYDIRGGKSKKELNEKSALIHIQCQYGYQEQFKKAFGCDIINWNGRLLQKDINEFVNGLDNFIQVLEQENNIEMFRGNLANIKPKDLINEILELKELVLNKKIRYLSIS